jgi:V/A-type H+-transporting ATPase subunit D
MITIVANPNRMELMRLRRRLQFAQRGHKLLKDKQESLMQEFMRILTDVRSQYAAVTEQFKKATQAMYQAKLGSTPYALEESLEVPEVATKLSVTQRRTMAGMVPTFTLEIAPPTMHGSPYTTPASAKAFLEAMHTLLPLMVKLAEVERTIECMAAELEKTRRRVNALEYNLIPALQQSIHGIIMKLEERDRAERVTIMKVKEFHYQ